MRKILSTRTILISALAALLAAMIVFLMAGGLDNSSKASAATKNTAPVSLIGDWDQTNGGIPGIVMSAEITDNKIVIELETTDSSGTYWIGTFDTSKKLAESFTTVSKGDQVKMSGMMYASLDPTKKFDYDHGVISFRLEILKVSTIVRLEKK